MKRVDLRYPCRADFGAMRLAPGGRFCDECQEVVHDLSAMSEHEAHALLEETREGRVCVRYVYDAASGDVVFGGRALDRGAIVPEHRLLSRVKQKLAMAAAIAAPLLVEACGGNDGNYRDRSGDPRQKEEEESMAELEAELESAEDAGAETSDESLDPEEPSD